MRPPELKTQGHTLGVRLAFRLKDFRVAIPGTCDLAETPVIHRDFRAKLTRRQRIAVSWLHLSVLCFAPKNKTREWSRGWENKISMVYTVCSASRKVGRNSSFVASLKQDASALLWDIKRALAWFLELVLFVSCPSHSGGKAPVCAVGSHLSTQVRNIWLVSWLSPAMFLSTLQDFRS